MDKYKVDLNIESNLDEFRLKQKITDELDYAYLKITEINIKKETQENI